MFKIYVLCLLFFFSFSTQDSFLFSFHIGNGPKLVINSIMIDFIFIICAYGVTWTPAEEVCSY